MTAQDFLNNADLISRAALTERINGSERPEIFDGAQEAEWIARCIREAPRLIFEEPGKPEPEPADGLDWEAAKEHLDFFADTYTRLGPVGAFGMITISGLKRRYSGGGRTRELYDEIMAIE